MYKVFINERVIYFTNNKDLVNTLPNCLVFNFFSANMTEILYQLVKNNQKIEHYVIHLNDYENAFVAFKKHFKVIKAAGGWVMNKENKSLFIFRLGKWDLPKGKIEKGENNEAAAIREVKEECGIASLRILGELPNTYHMYEIEGVSIFKQTYWYKMETDYEGELVPQLEEGITKVVWSSEEEINSIMLSNTYYSIKELIGFTSH
jgi:8-oxo-dGTP pyrophosphatase MutT (NUDIX family)